VQDRTFDTLVRRLARPKHRRALLGGLSGALLAAGVGPRATRAHGCPDLCCLFNTCPTKCTKKKCDCTDPDNADEPVCCKKQAKACVAVWKEYCADKYLDDNGPVPPSGNDYKECFKSYTTCCGFYKKCDEPTGDDCIAVNPW
jgi:hypothetical protein